MKITMESGEQTSLQFAGTNGRRIKYIRKSEKRAQKCTPLQFRPCASDFCAIKWERRGRKSARRGLNIGAAWTKNRRSMN